MSKLTQEIIDGYHVRIGIFSHRHQQKSLDSKEFEEPVQLREEVFFESAIPPLQKVGELDKFDYN